jgi:uroporphyrinogen decarboxylase
VLDVLRRGGGNPGGRGGHVFNLGHGVLPETDPETLERVVALVHGDGGHDGGAT